ncbi:unnamed protein product [Spirodela intermedia]|uniref:Uncharacterized protein n=1 Tax=Spirodela intermedia TaxID=51605 RepID=A0A811G6T9_SPIIN|nr:unnamed protein product [Spirodela intermedia]
MGSCMSAGEGSRVVNVAPTAKVIGLSGDLREYSSPISAAEALAKDGAAACFLCSSDKLYCNDNIPAVDPEEPLQLGQIYFVLPLEKRREALSQGDMAALAVKAISALAAAAEADGRRRKIRVVAPPEGGWGEENEEEEINGFAGKNGRRPPPIAIQRKMKRSGSLKGKNSSYRRQRSSRVRLGTIPEFVSE